jgi:hypothetical protein
VPAVPVDNLDRGRLDLVEHEQVDGDVVAAELGQVAAQVRGDAAVLAEEARPGHPAQRYVVHADSSTVIASGFTIVLRMPSFVQTVQLQRLPLDGSIATSSLTAPQ